MNGWGRVVFLVTAGLALGAGCGGRTGMPYDESYDPDPTGGVGGTPSSGGRPSTAGRSTGGSVTTGGRPNPAGGVSFGGVPSTGGAISFGGFAGGITTGGFGFGGFAGGFPTGGFSFGGFGGGFPTGGFGGVAGSGPFDCQSCVLETCGNELLQCFSDFGCLSILGCVQATGCDSFNCYSPETCGPVIDQWGGPFGPSMNALLETVSCTLTSGCPCN